MDSASQDLQALADRLLALAARSSLRPEAASALVGCAATLLCRVRPSAARLTAAVSALRAAGGDAALEAALLELGPGLTKPENP